MLKRFEVENFKGFSSRMIFDLTARDYGFNKNLIRNGIVNKAIIYGRNGIGKSSLGIAIFDIISHLTDKERLAASYLNNYRNLYNPEKPVTFVYYFQFGQDSVRYEYQKMSQDYLLSEKLFFNNDAVINYEYFGDTRFISGELLGDLNVELIDNKLSVVKYIYKNRPTNSVPLLTKMLQFCENMLWFRQLSEGTAYTGFTTGSEVLAERIYSAGKKSEFERFLKSNGIDYKLEFHNVNGEHKLYAVFGNSENAAEFGSIASTGTKALYLFYYWMITAFDHASFVFIDEFDAFFHYESAEMIVKILNDEARFQSVLTSHNTYLMQNKLTRPDCCYLMGNHRVSNLYEATDKEIREAHNLEKMYINGAFTE